MSIDRLACALLSRAASGPCGPLIALIDVSCGVVHASRSTSFTPGLPCGRLSREPAQSVNVVLFQGLMPGAYERRADQIVAAALRTSTAGQL